MQFHRTSVRNPVRCSHDDERGSTAHLRPASLRPHLRRTHQPPLAQGSGQSTVQDGRAHVKTTHGTAPSYLSQLVRVTDLPGRRYLRSARTNRLLVPSVKLSTVGGRAFPVAGPTIWNSLLDSVISAPSLSTFRQRLQHFCSRPRFLTLSSIPGKLFPTSSGS